MTTTSPETKRPGGARVAVQRFGTFLSGMIMPNIPALIAWGIFTAFFIDVGWIPNADLATIVGPFIHYALPILIAYTGGNIVYGIRGGVVAVIGTFGVIAGSDLLVAQYNAAAEAAGDPTIPQIHQFIGAMIMAPIAAYTMKWLDNLWEGKIRAGFEMLVNMFSAGIWGFVMAIVGFYPVALIVNWIMAALGRGVEWLVDMNLLPLTSIIIEPAKVFFLNNAINHGVLTPLGLQEASDTGSSILVLLEANPGPGVGLLLAFTIFGIGAARASAPGSIFAVIAQVANNSYFAVLLSVVLSATVTFVIAGVILRASRKRDLEAMAATDDAFGAAITQTEAAKGKSSDALANLRGGAATQADGQGGSATGTVPEIKNVVFACDAGMGSSAMGASVLRNKFKKAGIEDVTVVNKAIANLDSSADLVITQNQLTDRARQQTPDAVHVSVDNFMNSPKYDEVVDLVKGQHETQP